MSADKDHKDWQRVLASWSRYYGDGPIGHPLFVRLRGKARYEFAKLRRSGYDEDGAGTRRLAKGAVDDLGVAFRVAQTGNEWLRKAVLLHAECLRESKQDAELLESCAGLIELERAASKNGGTRARGTAIFVLKLAADTRHDPKLEADVRARFGSKYEDVAMQLLLQARTRGLFKKKGSEQYLKGFESLQGRPEFQEIANSIPR